MRGAKRPIGSGYYTLAVLAGSTPHPALGHLLPQGEKGHTRAVRMCRLLPLREKVANGRMRGSNQTPFTHP